MILPNHWGYHCVKYGFRIYLHRYSYVILCRKPDCFLNHSSIKKPSRRRKIMKEKNTVAIINKNQIYAYGDDAYAMYEKAPESIQVTHPVANGVIADYNNMQTLICENLEKHLKMFVKNIPWEKLL